jgi:hypothetical protein
MNATAVVDRKKLKYSVSGRMHPQYSAPDVRPLVDPSHTMARCAFRELG